MLHISPAFIEVLIPLSDNISPLLRTPLISRIPSLLLLFPRPGSRSFLILLMLLVLFLLLVPSFPPLSLSPLEGILAGRSLLQPVFRMLKVHLLKEILFERFGKGLDVHIIAVSSSFAAAIDVLLALSVEEVGDG